MRTTSLFAGALLGLVALGAQATTFTVTRGNLGDGYVISGTLETDGTTGALSSANLVRWNLTVTQTTDTVFDPTNSTADNISLVTSTGKKLLVATSPDGYTDGGLLAFGGAGPRGGIPATAIVADFGFSGLNLGGGIAGWVSELGLNVVDLNQPDGTNYKAACVITGKPNVFRVLPVTISPAPTRLTLTGTITTDGTIGPLAPQNIVAWKLVGREQDSWNYTEKNSAVLALDGISTDGVLLTADSQTGILDIGVPSVNPSLLGTSLKLVDFTDPGYPGGVSSYFRGNFGLQAARSPLTTRATYTFARVK